MNSGLSKWSPARHGGICKLISRPVEFDPETSQEKGVTPVRTRKSLRRLRLAVGVFTVVFGAGLVVPTTVAGAAQADQPAIAQTPLPVRDGSAAKLGPYSPSQTIRLAIGLRPPHMAAEQ